MANNSTEFTDEEKLLYAKKNKLTVSSGTVKVEYDKGDTDHVEIPFIEGMPIHRFTPRVAFKTFQVVELCKKTYEKEYKLIKELLIPLSYKDSSVLSEDLYTVDIIDALVDNREDCPIELSLLEKLLKRRHSDVYYFRFVNH